MKKFYSLILAAIVITASNKAVAQSAITSIVSTYESSTDYFGYNAPGAPSSSFTSKNYGYTFGSATQSANNTKRLVSFKKNGDTYTYESNANSEVRIRRVNNTNVNGTRTLLWVERKTGGPDSIVSVINPYNDNMELAFSDNALNQGTDNLFANQGDGNGNINDIERMDVIFAGGVISAVNTKVGFALFERGTNNQHDGFVVAAITAIDIDGNPTAFGSPVRATSASYGNLPSSSTNFYVVRRDFANESVLKMSTSGTQDIGGVFVSFADLGISSGTKIFGYAIFANDLPVTATAANLLDYTNTTYFPANTDAGGGGGIDLLALTGVLSTQNSIILPPTADNILNHSVVNTSETIGVLPFNATAASGSIATYTVQTLPPTSKGIMYLCDAGNCTPLTVGQVVLPSQVINLSFQPNPGFTGNFVFYYYAYDTYTQKSNVASYTIPVIALSTPVLAVKMTSFMGSASNKTATLKWQTAQEQKSSYFEVQRSSDGINFEPVATVTAKGNSDVASNYYSLDDLTFFKGAKVFYRLKMVDITGKFNYSSVITLQLKNIKTNISVWPNPFAGQLKAAYTSSVTEMVQLKVSGIDGRTVYSSNVQMQKGNNSISLDQLGKLSAGTYFLNIASSDKVETSKIIKN